jgi:sialidase-1
LTNGRLLMAVGLHKTPETKWVSKGRLWSYYSDDNGKTWNSGTEVPTPDSIITQEPGVVELKNGDIMMFIRASSNCQLISFSKDKGKSWSMAQRSNISSPLSPASIKRIPGRKDLLLVWNNNDGQNQLIKGRRTPFNIAISKDDGKTWGHMKTLEDDTDGWYCYTAIHFVGNDVLLGNCAGSRSKKTELSVLNVTKIDLDWVYE